MKTFLVGFAFGIVGGILFAPKRGQLFRADLSDKAHRVVDAAEKAVASPARTEKLPTPNKKSPEGARAPSSTDETEAAAKILNTATRNALIAVHGIGQALADRVIDNRPYQQAYEVVEKGILPESTFVQLKRELLNKSA